MWRYSKVFDAWIVCYVQKASEIFDKKVGLTLPKNTERAYFGASQNFWENFPRCFQK